jgi:hypothetical protein
MNQLTPLELLNLYLSDGKSIGPVENKLYQKFNKELSWDAILNESYQADLCPLPCALCPLRYALCDAPSSSPDALRAMRLVQNVNKQA